MLATIAGTWVEAAGPNPDLLDLVALPVMSMLSLGLMLGFLRAKRLTVALELGTFLMLAAFFLLQLAGALYLPNGLEPVNDELIEFSYWFPTLYAAILFILGVENGWRVAIGHYLISVLLGLPYIFSQLQPGGMLLDVYALSQLYLSCGVIITTAMTFVRYTEGMARAKAEAESMAHTDFVTTLGNRRQMERQLTQEVRRAERYGQELGILLLDLDHFKRVNDRFGHPVGDVTLRAVSQFLLSEARTTDFVGRWGGEEFMFILPNTSEEALEAFAQRVVDHLAAHRFDVVGRLTASLGGAALNAGESRDELVRRADDALYRAKDEGRNCVVVATSRAVAS